MRLSQLLAYLALGLSFLIGCRERRNSTGVSGPDMPVEVAPDLPRWVAVEVASMGKAPVVGHDFIMPEPLGESDDGVVYVLDRALQEVRSFASTGTWLETLVKKGQGPNEMQQQPLDFGFRDNRVWWSDVAAGRIHYVSAIDRSAVIEETALTGPRFGAAWVRVIPVSDSVKWLEKWFIPAEKQSIRPSIRVEYVFVAGGNTIPVGSWTGSGSYLYFDNGLTQIVFPGVDEYPMYIPAGPHRVLRIERRVDERAPGRIHIAIDSAGRTVRQSSVAIRPVRLTSAGRDSLQAAILKRSTFGGRLPRGADDTRRVSDLVASLPHYLPAVSHAAFDVDDRTWLKLATAWSPAGSDWLVLDADLTPLAYVEMPRSVTRLVFTESGDVLTQVLGADDVRYVGRFRIQP